MGALEVRPGVLAVGVQDRISKFFDNLMPLPDGTSYNSYLVQGSDATALIDTVDPRFADELLGNLSGIEKIDFIIANHAEQDHTGALPKVLERYPSAIIVCNEKCKHALQKELFLSDEKFKIIKDKEVLYLGGKSLQFMFAPWVHWPETMFTYLIEDSILFTCDLFGAHLASDKLWVESSEEVLLPAKRYYAQIMMPFAKLVHKYTLEVRELKPSIIAPSHGPMYGSPEIVLSWHELWTSVHLEKRVVIAYVSMHGSTRRMAEHLVWKLKEQGVDAQGFDVMETDIGDITMALLNCATLVVASPAYLGGLHPSIAHFLFLINGFRPNIQFVGYISSHGWEKECGFDQVEATLTHIKPKYLNPIFIEGYPGEGEFHAIDGLVEDIKGKHHHI